MNSEPLILLAEDSVEDEWSFKRALKKSGLKNPVAVVRDGDEAIAYLQAKGYFADRQRFPAPGILILDLTLRRKNGWEVLRWVRSEPEFHALFVVVLTGSVRVEDLQRAYTMGANSFLTKPCTAEDLLELAFGFPEQWPAATALSHSI